jgi:hypothetical protein
MPFGVGVGDLHERNPTPSPAGARPGGCRWWPGGRGGPELLPDRKARRPRAMSPSSCRAIGRAHQLAGGSLAGKDCAPHSSTMSSKSGSVATLRRRGGSRPGGNHAAGGRAEASFEPGPCVRLIIVASGIAPRCRSSVMSCGPVLHPLSSSRRRRTVAVAGKSAGPALPVDGNAPRRGAGGVRHLVGARRSRRPEAGRSSRGLAQGMARISLWPPESRTS